MALGYSDAGVALKTEESDTRKKWFRFVAVRADAGLAAPMYPRFRNGSVLLIDRHYCSLAGYRKDEPNLIYALQGRGTYSSVGRNAELQLCLRPERNDYPLDFISVDRKNPLESCIVGRVAHVATETLC